MTIVGLHDFVKVSISASLKSFLLIICIDAPESTKNSSSSGLRFDAGRHLFSEGEKNVALSCSFSFHTLLASSHAASRAPGFCPVRTVWLWVPRDNGNLNCLKWTRNHAKLNQRTTMSLEDPCNSPWRFLCSSPRSGRSQISECSQNLISSKVFLFRLWSGIQKYSPFLGVNTSYALRVSSTDFWCVHLFKFLSVRDEDALFPYSPLVQRTSKEYAWQDFWTELMQSRQVFGRNVVIFDRRSKRNNWAIEWYSEPPFKRCLPIRQEILNVSQIAVALHGVRPLFFIQTWLQQNRMSLPSPCALLSRQSNLFLICAVLTYIDSRKDLHNFCQIPRNCKCKWLLVPRRLQELLQALLCFLRSFFVLHGYDCIHCVAKSCTTAAYRWFFEVHILHWDLCDRQVLNHRNFPLWARLHQCVLCKKHL